MISKCTGELCEKGLRTNNHTAELSCSVEVAAQMRLNGKTCVLGGLRHSLSTSSYDVQTGYETLNVCIHGHTCVVCATH